MLGTASRGDFENGGRAFSVREGCGGGGASEESSVHQRGGAIFVMSGSADSEFCRRRWCLRVRWSVEA